MILNQDLEWAQVAAIKIEVKIKDEIEYRLVGGAFRENSAEKILLPPGTELYKFNGYPSLTNLKGEVSGWWQPYQPFRHDPGWLQKVQTAKRFNVSVREWGRVTSAVQEDWNSLEHLLVIALSDPIYAWFGGYTSMQRLDSHFPSLRNKNFAGEERGIGTKLPGGATQFYIPNLLPSHIANWRTESLEKM